MEQKIGFNDMLRHLLEVDDYTWGLYAFSRELLNKRIQPQERDAMIKKAIACGKEYAKRTIQETGSQDINIISDKLNLQVEYSNASMIGKRILFANFTPPSKIEIIKEPVKQLVTQIQKETPFLVEHFKQNDIINIILGHEIFHSVEERYEQTIYTRTEKILLWNFLGFKNYSVIRTLGEIGAMAFTKEINGINYSPFIYDVLLYYCYDPAGAWKIYYEVLANQVRKVHGAIENC